MRGYSCCGNCYWSVKKDVENLRVRYKGRYQNKRDKERDIFCKFKTYFHPDKTEVYVGYVGKDYGRGCDKWRQEVVVWGKGKLKIEL